MKKYILFILLIICVFNNTKAQRLCNSAIQIAGNTTVPASTTNNTFTGLGYNLGCNSVYSSFPNNQKATWMYAVVSRAGSINMNFGNTGNRDVDWSVWGPFAANRSIADICSSKMDNLAPVICDTSPGPGASGTVNPTQVGQIYIILVVNFSSTATNYTLNFTGAGSLAPVQVTASSNADLSDLTINSAVLTPVFTSGTTAYSTSVSNSTSSVSITPTVSDANANIQMSVNGGNYTAITSNQASSAIALNIGNNTIASKVTAQDGTTVKTYSVTIIREKAPQTIAFNAITPKSYGNADFDAGASASSGLAVTYASDNVAVATIVNNKIHIVGAGIANITASQAGDNNYKAATAVTQNLTVNKAPLILTATNQTKTYGTTNPELTVGYSGFVNGETNTVLTTQPIIATPATTASAVGSYPVNVSGATAANYQISYVNGSLSIYPGIQTITFTAQTKTYGDPDFTVSATASSGLPVTYSSNNPTVATVDNDGTVHIVAVGLVVISALQPGNGNYVATTRINQQIIINKAALTITANNQNKNYGDANPVLTINYNGFVYGETAANLTVRPAISTTATTNSAVGNYLITVGSAAASNYSFIYVNGLLTIDQIKQTLAFAAPDTKTYGDADFALNVTASSGLPVTYINSDPTVATVNSAGMVHILSAGNTTIIASQPGNSIYSATADIAQNLTVNKAALTLIADDQTISYGAAIPILTFHGNGFVNGETPAVLTAQPVLNTTATTTSDAGTYPITIADAAAANYNITYLPGTLTISPAVQAIAVNSPIVKTYGDTDFNLNASSNTTFPLIYTSSNPALATVDASGNVHILSAGAVTFTVSHAGNNNYASTSVTQIITINKASLIITADDHTRAYGAANPVLTVSYNGFVNAETTAVFSTPVTVSTTATVNSPAGNYPITPSNAVAANYVFTYVPATLTVSNPMVSGVSFVQNTVFENQPVQTLAGTLAGNTLDPDAVFTYTFLSGTGSADNSSFTIQGNKLLTAKSFNFEQQASYSILVRATNQYGLYFDQPLTIQITDVNEIPTLAAIADQLVCNLPSAQKINLTGITPGPESAQTTTFSVSSTNPSLFTNLSVGTVSGGAAALNYTLNGTGSATITITVNDNGGTANGGMDSFSQTFTLTANEVPVVAVSSDIGTQMIKGQTATLTATGGNTYSWANASGIVGATNSAVLQVRPYQNTTYLVTATNASGCSTTASITINVTDDLESVQANNLITPNGDGKNDTWVVKNIDLYPESTIIIFDKAGRRLLNVKHYNNDWDGTYQGSPLAEGTYYYVIDFGAGKPPLKGFITLLRNR